MLRPATPLTILLFAAFVLLLIAVISTPIIKQIPLARFGGVDFGVFGYCQASGCSPIEIGYSTESLFNTEEADSFNLPTSTRATLSAILIVHPIAAAFTLLMTILSAAAHLHKPSHSPRYLLGIFILSILTLILALLSFLIDVLLFVPHMAWGSYIVLAATILIAASGIVSCAMRRTLVSRKARKRRIEENAEMNGDNFYNRQGPAIPLTAPSNTLVGGSQVDKLPEFATFDMAKKEPERVSDERVPLTAGSSSDPNVNGTTLNNSTPGVAGSDRYRQGQSPPRDQYGNPIPRPPPGSAYGGRSRDPSVDPSLNRQYSDNSMSSRGRGMPPGGFRGRGGFAPNGRGGYGPPRGGGYGPRGGFNGPYRGGMDMGGAMAGGAMMRGGRGARGGPPPGYGRGPPPGSGYGQRPPNPEENYGGNYNNNNYGAPPVGYAAYNQADDRSSLARAESPPPLNMPERGPVGQAIEMDATTGSPSPSGRPPQGFGQFGNIRDSDGDVAGMVGLQQQKLDRHQTAMTEESGSRYSTDEYVPPRQAWADQPARSSPLNSVAVPAELPTQGRARRSSDHYYEDVDPRFAEVPPPQPIISQPVNTGYNNNNLGNNMQLQPMDGQRSYEDLQSGSRSPAESDRSTFTSVSQRGVNPRWNGGAPPQAYGQQPMPRRPVNQPSQQRDMLLNTNPDFQLPGGRGRGPARGGRGVGGGGIIPSSAYPGGAL